METMPQEASHPSHAIIARNAKRERRALNGINLASLEQDGKWHFGWSGRAWIVFCDGILMAFGGPTSDTKWMASLCSSYNGLYGPGRVDFGHKPLRLGPAEIAQWEAAEALLSGKLENNRDAGTVLLDEMEVTTAIIKKAVDVAEI